MASWVQINRKYESINRSEAQRLTPAIIRRWVCTPVRQRLGPSHLVQHERHRGHEEFLGRAQIRKEKQNLNDHRNAQLVVFPNSIVSTCTVTPLIPASCSGSFYTDINIHHTASLPGEVEKVPSTLLTLGCFAYMAVGYSGMTALFLHVYLFFVCVFCVEASQKKETSRSMGTSFR